jgi:hypothetical protein
MEIAMNIKNYIAISPKYIAKLFCCFALICCVVQVLLGESLSVLFFAELGIAVGLFVFSRFPWNYTGTWFLFLFLFGNTLFAVIFKTMFFQPISSYLYTPETSFIVEFFGVLSLSTAVYFSSRINVGKPVLKPEHDPYRLNVIALGSFAIGLLGWIFSGSLGASQAAGMGGFSIFRDAIFMAIICRTALLLERSNTDFPIDIYLVIIFVVVEGLGFLSDTRGYIALPFVYYFATIAFYRKKINIKYLVPILLFGTFFVSFIAPLINVLRSFGQEEASFTQRISLVLGTVENILSGGYVRQVLGKVDTLYGENYYNYFGPNGFGQIVAGRLASIQQIDPIIDGANRHGFFDYPIISNALKLIAPSFLVDKTGINGSPFDITVYYGLQPVWSGNKSPTVPLLGQMYCIYGPIKGILSTFLVFFFTLLGLKKVGWNLDRNVFAIFFFCQFVFPFASQGVFEQYMDFLFRYLPEFVVIFYVLQRLPRLRYVQGDSHILKSRFNAEK